MAEHRHHLPRDFAGGADHREPAGGDGLDRLCSDQADGASRAAARGVLTAVRSLRSICRCRMRPTACTERLWEDALLNWGLLFVGLLFFRYLAGVLMLETNGSVLLAVGVLHILQCVGWHGRHSRWLAVRARRRSPDPAGRGVPSAARTPNRSARRLDLAGGFWSCGCSAARASAVAHRSLLGARAQFPGKPLGVSLRRGAS